MSSNQHAGTRPSTRRTLAVAAATVAAFAGSLAAAPAQAQTGHGAAQADVPVNLTVDNANVLVGTKVHLRGTGAPRTKVDIYAKYVSDPNHEHLVSTKVTNSDGSFELGTTMRVPAWFTAYVKGESDFVYVHSHTKIVSFSAKPLGDGKVEWKINGAPSVKGYANVYEYQPEDQDGRNKRIGHVATDKHGDATLVTTSAPGPMTFVLGFQYPYAGVGKASKVLTVQ